MLCKATLLDYEIRLLECEPEHRPVMSPPEVLRTEDEAWDNARRFGGRYVGATREGEVVCLDLGNGHVGGFPRPMMPPPCRVQEGTRLTFAIDGEFRCEWVPARVSAWRAMELLMQYVIHRYPGKIAIDLRPRRPQY